MNVFESNPDRVPSNLVGLVGGGSSTITSSKLPNTVPLVDLLRWNELEERLRRMEEKCNVILVKVPVLESRTEEVATLKRELEVEREERRENERRFMECVDKLMEEIVQLTLKVMKAEEKVEAAEKRSQASLQEIIYKVKMEMVEESGSDNVVPTNPHFPVTPPPPPPPALMVEENLINTADPVLTSDRDQNQLHPQQTAGEKSHPILLACLSGANLAQLENFGGYPNQNEPQELLQPNVDLSLAPEPEQVVKIDPIPYSRIRLPLPRQRARRGTESDSDIQALHGVGKQIMGLAGEPPVFSCHCGLTYTRKQTLLHHIKTKTMSAGTVFQCRICLNRYDTHGKLKLHVKFSHKASYWDEGKLACGFCGEMFDTLKQIKDHQAATHR